MYIVTFIFDFVNQKYRQLDADGKRDVDDFTDMKLMQAQRKADEQWEQLSPEKEELKLG